jgi:hypothetical protein
VIQHLHGADATHIESMPVKEMLQRKAFWDGVVQVVTTSPPSPVQLPDRGENSVGGVLRGAAGDGPQHRNPRNSFLAN